MYITILYAKEISFTWQEDVLANSLAYIQRSTKPLRFTNAKIKKKVEAS
jgi:hypothetical protein